MKGYEKLDDVLARAFQQASQGKGKERHANDLPFHEQPMQQVNRMVGVGFSHGQAIKKIVESQNMPPEQAVHELLGAICYIAGGIITLEAANDNKQPVKLKSLTVFVNGEPVNTNPQPDIKFEPIEKRETFEYLDHNFQLVEVEAGSIIGGDWRKVPADAVAFIKQPNVWSGFICDMKHVGSAKILWQRDPSAMTRETARETLSNMGYAETVEINGITVEKQLGGDFFACYKNASSGHRSTSIEQTLKFIFGEELS